MARLKHGGILILTLITFWGMAKSECQAGILQVFMGNKTFRDVKTELLQFSTIVGWLCSALVLACGKMAGNAVTENQEKQTMAQAAVENGLVIWAVIANHVGNYVMAKLSGFDARMTHVLDELFLCTLFVVSFLVISFVIEKVFNRVRSLDAHLSWLAYYIIVITLIKFY